MLKNLCLVWSARFVWSWCHSVVQLPQHVGITIHYSMYWVQRCYICHGANTSHWPVCHAFWCRLIFLIVYSRPSCDCFSIAYNMLVFCCISRLFMEELVNYICRVPLPERSAFWKDEHIQKWVLTVFLML